jgi:crotonobetainyl-CoA:carnitine CoA-transferase CaiB-like acyl-CoA transferase
MQAMPNGPLEGIRVVEWAHQHLGPGASMFLGDMGAEVVKLETRDGGDSLRRLASLWGYEFLLDHERNTFTEDLLRNKRSMTVDLNQGEGRDIVHRLVERADVFVTNFRPAAARKQQLDYETLSALNYRLIYARGTAYGERGPDADKAGLEMMGQAHGGLMLGSAKVGSEPVYPTIGLNDRLGAIGLAFAILGALVARARTGKGQMVRTSLLGWTLSLQAVAISCAANTGQDPRPLDRRDQHDPLYNVYQLNDGTWIALGMIVHGERDWPVLCTALGLERLIDDPRFTTHADRDSNHRELIAIFDEAFAELTWPEWDKRAREHQLISCRVNALTDLSGDEQVLANQYMTRLPHPELGEFWYVPTPVDFSETPVSIRSEAPHVGQHTDEVLGELDFSPEQIDDLRRREVV